MVRAALERVLGADRLDLWYERTAQKPSTRDLLFSSVYDLMHHVVFCVQPSVRAASQAHHTDVGTSLVSVSNTLNGIETHAAAELVRYSARAFAPLIQPMGGARAPGLEGYRIKIVMATASQPVSIACKHCVKPRGVPGPAPHWGSLNRPWGRSPMSSRAKRGMRRNARCSGPSWTRGRPVIAGLQTAIFVPAPCSVRSTSAAPSALRAHSRGSLVRLSLPCARLGVRQRGTSLSSACVWWRRTATRLSCVACVSRGTKRPETGRRVSTS